MEHPPAAAARASLAGLRPPSSSSSDTNLLAHSRIAGVTALGHGSPQKLHPLPRFYAGQSMSCPGQTVPSSPPPFFLLFIILFLIFFVPCCLDRPRPFSEMPASSIPSPTAMPGGFFYPPPHLLPSSNWGREGRRGQCPSVP